jgi:hypothetical protein
MPLFIANIFLSGCSSSELLSQPAKPLLPQSNVTCNELSFYLDPALGNGTKCESVLESTSPDMPSYYVFIYPAHTELTIQNYPLTQTQFPPQIWVYPVQRFSELLPDIIPARVYELQSFISTGIWEEKVRPFLPTIFEKQSFVTHEKALSFNGGQGVRYVTQYTEGPNPITNRNIIYTFQGLTDDEIYWVAVTLPISNPILPDEYNTLPQGYTQERLMLDYDTYIGEVQSALNKQTLDSFTPGFNSLDKLVESITINP